MEHNILLVDDDPGLIRVMARILAGLGQFRFATHGEAALQQARDWLPDLVILDAEMPGMSGFQVCEAMKADPALRDVPIIFVTSHSDHEFEVRGLEIGAVDFLAKPVNEALAVARVRTQLRVKRLTDELRRMATKDAPTQLPNRVSFDEQVNKEWARGLQAGTAISLLLVEVDHLDRYTERYGHQMADACLRKVSGVLQAACQRPADLVARYGHSTFALLLPASAHMRAEDLAHQVIDDVERAAIGHENSPISRHVTITVGLSNYDTSCASWVVPPGEDGVGEIPVCGAGDLKLSAEAALKAARDAGRAQAWRLGIDHASQGKKAVEVIPLGRLQPLLAVA